MQFSQRVTGVTQDTILPKAYDNILSDNFMSFRLVGNGKKWSGETLKGNVKLIKSTAGGSFSGNDQFTMGQTDGRKQLQYYIKGYEQPVVINGLEALVNATDAQVINLIKIETDSAAQDSVDDIADMLYGDGTGNAGKDFDGLDVLDDDGTTSTNVGTLSRTTYTTLAGTRTAWGGLMSLTKLAALHASISGGSASRQSPTIIVSDETTWGLFEGLLTPTVRANYDTNGFPMVTRKSRGAVAGGAFNGGQGFQSLMYRGVPWVKDEKSPVGTVWMLNENYLDWYGIKDPEMTQISFGDTIDGVYSEAPSDFTGLQFSGFMKPVNQYGKVGHIYLFGNLTTFAPRRQGRGTGATGI